MSEDAEEGVRLRVPACDACKARKVKCDKKIPCSSCAASKIPCRTTKRAPEKRQRVLLSNRYGDEIADVNEKLELLSETIRDLVQSKQNKVGNLDRSPSLLAPPRDDSPSTSAAENLYEGDTSFIAQSRLIAETLGSAFQNSPQALENGPRSAATSTIHRLLQEVVSSRSALPNPSSSAFAQYSDLASLPLLPVELVLKLLRWAKDQRHRFFIEFPLLTVEIFTELCQKIYFPADEYGISVWIVVHCGLFYLFYYYDAGLRSHLDMTETAAEDCRKKCVFNAESAVQRLRLCTDPTLDNAEALILAATMYMDLAKPPMAWTLVCAAARMCLDLGLHRQPSNTTGLVAKRQRLIFWYAYACDKGLALNYGRTPTIRDYDITTERPRVPEDFYGPWGHYYSIWMDFAELQGAILEQLFSARAQQEPQEVRTQRALALAARIDELNSSFNVFSSNPLEHSQMKGLMTETIMSTDVVINSLKTLIYKCVPPRQPAHPLQFCDECVTAARAALKTLVAAWEEVKLQDDETWRMFINWTLLFIPFVPFIVMFGNVIAQNNREDLVLLEKVVETMQAAARVTTAVQKMTIACERLCRVAQAYSNQQETIMGFGSEKAHERHHDTGKMSDKISTSGAEDPAVDMDPSAGAGILDSLPDFAWDEVFSSWDMGPGAESAREMGNFFGQYIGTSGNELGDLTVTTGFGYQ